MTDTSHRILVTGGTGYIGSHTVVDLLEAGHEVVIVDNLCNSKASVIDRIEQITGRRPDLVIADIGDRAALERIFARDPVSEVMHFAGLKAVGESLEEPLRYYENNVCGTVTLLKVMQAAGCKRMVFSSSATVYGATETVPIPENAPISPTNPYGWSKAIIEEILMDLARSDPEWNIALLRYFNPVGAHESGLIGEDPAGIPNNLMPFIAQTAVGRLERLTVYGDDYPTRDGTAERDYVHVVDLAHGHLAALGRLSSLRGATAINLGTGRGQTVNEMVAAFEKTCGVDVPRIMGPRRGGDVARSYADPSLAHRLLGWQAMFDVHRMCADAWRWQRANPEGFPPAPSSVAL